MKGSEPAARLFVVEYQHIDFLDMILPAAKAQSLVDQKLLPCTQQQAAAAFIEAGWEGDGEIGAIWIPPFMFTGGETWGAFLWHVKQSNNGTSWLCAGRRLDFPGVNELVGVEWQEVNLKS